MSNLLLRLLVDASIRATLVTALIATILVVTRVRAAGVTHAAWTAVLSGMLLMPLLPYCVPAIGMPFSVGSFTGSGTESDLATRRVVTTDRATGPSAPLLEQPALARSVAAVPSTSRTPNPVRSWRPLRPIVALGAYGVGVSILMLRLLTGCAAARKLRITSGRILFTPDLQALVPGINERGIFDSAFVAAPVTVGVIVPAIILPITWKEWSTHRLHAVLSHELAHVKRRDPLVNALAHLNCCVFWFHPLAWWLKRTLAATAEHACDEAAIRAVGDARGYAELLIDIAEATRRRGGRVSWQAVGIANRHLLGQRIDRVLRGENRVERSPVRKAVVVASSAAAILIVAACQRPSAPPAALWEDPRPAEADAQRQSDVQAHVASGDMNSQQVADLEAAWVTNREDLATLDRLLVFYWAHLGPDNAPIDQRMTERRRTLALWLLEHHPDSELAGAPEARLFPEGFGPRSDPVGYRLAQQRWLTKTKQPDASPTALGNAATFFEATDKPLAEAMLVRARAADPRARWTERLGRFCAVTLVGGYMPTSARTAPRDMAAAEPKGAFAASVRQKLAESSDEALLTSAAEQLLRTPTDTRREVARLLARPLLQRAVELNPSSIRARSGLVWVQSRERTLRVRRLLDQVPLISEYQAISTRPDTERFEALLEANRHGSGSPETLAEWRKDPNLTDYFRLTRTRDRKNAEDLLKMARTVRDGQQGTAIYLANMKLGSMALGDGDRKAAVAYMRNASLAPVSEELAYSRRIAAWRLIRELLEQGERESVVAFLERMARISVVDRADLLRSAAEIRRGQMPGYYWLTSEDWVRN